MGEPSGHIFSLVGMRPVKCVKRPARLLSSLPRHQLWLLDHRLPFPLRLRQDPAGAESIVYPPATTQRAIDNLWEAHTLAQKIGVLGELWQIQSRLGDLYERRGEEIETQKAYSLAAQTLRKLARKIADEELREGFLSAPQARRVLGHTS